MLFCSIEKRLLVALPVAAAIVLLAYAFSFYVGVRDAAFPAVVALAILGYVVSKPVWVIVERAHTSDYGQIPVLVISRADVEYYTSLVGAIHKAEEAYTGNSGTMHQKSLSRINRNEAYKILHLIRDQNPDRSSKEFYVEYDSRVYHTILQFQYQRPKLVD